jgi:glycine/D-amino acid oxidase-like deaminating enzyme
MTGLDATHGLWAESSPPRPATSALAGNIHADVVIVGGGFTGCSAALHLAEKGCSAVVLEARQIGFGGSGRNVGLVNAGMWVMPDDLPAILGEVHGERLLQQLGEAPRHVFEIIDRFAIACEAERAGTLHCAIGDSGMKELTARAAQWQARGVPIELLGAEQTASRIGSAAYSGSMLDPRAGTIQPLAYVRGLANAASGLGARFYTGSPVTAREDLGGTWRISTSSGSVMAPTVIVATDAYSTGIFSGVREEQIMLPYFNFATRPLDQVLRATILPGKEGVWDTAQILSSFRLDHAGRLVFGSVGALRNGGASVHRAWARRELRRLFPQLDAVAFEYEWFGMIGMTADALPRFHEHDRRMFSVSGYNGRGIAPGTTFGRDLARLALGDITVDDLSLPSSPQSKAALRRLKGQFYEYGALLAHLVGSRV